MLNQTKSATRQSKIRRFIATAKRFLGLVLLLKDRGGSGRPTLNAVVAALGH